METIAMPDQQTKPAAVLCALVLEHGLHSTEDQRIIVMRRTRDDELFLPTEPLYGKSSDAEVLARLFRLQLSMIFTRRVCKVGHWIADETSPIGGGAAEVLLCHATGTPRFRSDKYEALWIEPSVLMDPNQSKVTSKTFLQIFRWAAALCAHPLFQVPPLDVRKIPDCCRPAVSDSEGPWWSNDIALCRDGIHLVQCCDQITVWYLPPLISDDDTITE